MDRCEQILAELRKAPNIRYRLDKVLGFSTITYLQRLEKRGVIISEHQDASTGGHGRRGLPGRNRYGYKKLYSVKAIAMREVPP
jgi:hypothetical protein